MKDRRERGYCLDGCIKKDDKHPRCLIIIKNNDGTQSMKYPFWDQYKQKEKTQ